MKKQVVYSGKGQNELVEGYNVYRLLPNETINAVGPFVTLDHATVDKHTYGHVCHIPEHAHKGMTTLTYVINGEAVHLDSAGNFKKVCSGGVHWLNAGKGIAHQEVICLSEKPDQWVTHVFHFSVNLPPVYKNESPQHISLQSEEMPQLRLPHNSGGIKVIIGCFESLRSNLPTHTHQFIYHLQLEGGKRFSMPTHDHWRYGALIPFNRVMINENAHEQGELIVFEKNNGEIEFVAAYGQTDILLFGGERLREPFVADGSFALNTEHEITQAYNDYYEGKYGCTNTAILSQKINSINKKNKIMQTVETTRQTKWTMDKLHSEIGFKVKHLMISNTKGVFKDYEASIFTEGDDFSTATIDLRIDPASIYTRDEQRDAHLRNADFFDVEQFDEIRFTGQRFETLKNGEAVLHGDLTMKGITKSIRLNVESGGVVNDPWGSKRAGFVITGKINRKDWGLTWSPLLETGGMVVGEDIAIHCEIELIQEAVN